MESPAWFQEWSGIGISDTEANKLVPVKLEQVLNSTQSWSVSKQMNIVAQQVISGITALNFTPKVAGNS